MSLEHVRVTGPGACPDKTCRRWAHGRLRSQADRRVGEVVHWSGRRADPKISRRLTCGVGPSTASTLIALSPQASSRFRAAGPTAWERGGDFEVTEAERRARPGVEPTIGGGGNDWRGRTGLSTHGLGNRYSCESAFERHAGLSETARRPSWVRLLCDLFSAPGGCGVFARSTSIFTTQNQRTPGADH